MGNKKDCGVRVTRDKENMSSQRQRQVRRFPSVGRLALAAVFLGLFGHGSVWGETRWTVGQRAVAAAALKSSVPPELALAVARVGRKERFRESSAPKAVGVMQVLPSVAWEELGLRAYGLEHPRANAGVGVTLLERLNRRYDGRWDLTLSHYRRGPLLRCNEGPVMHDGTLKYVAAVMDWWVRYQKDAAFTSLLDEARGARFLDDGVGFRQGDDARAGDGRNHGRPLHQDRWHSGREEGCSAAPLGQRQVRSDDGSACATVRSRRFF